MKTNQGLAYGINFDTKEMPGKIVFTRVALDRGVMGMKDSVRVDLRDHPLYEHLYQYCINNPPDSLLKGKG